MSRGPVVVVICANAEWRGAAPYLPDAERGATPFGEWRADRLPEDGEGMIFVHTGWGKIAAAAATQYVIDRWHPRLLINIGTCGGFHGSIEPGEIILAERTVVYDIVELMGDQEEAIAHYAMELPGMHGADEHPFPVRRTTIVSADRDLHPEEIPMLKERFGAVAADWESGAIAWTAGRNGVPLVILRGVSDLVAEHGGEAYGAIELFEDRCPAIMARLIGNLTTWVRIFDEKP